MKFCFWGDVNKALIGKTAGGAELQIALLARALRKIGEEVIIIDFNAEFSYITTDGIKVVNIPEWNEGIRFFRFITHRLPALWKAFKTQNADYYYVRGRSLFHIIPYLISRKLSAKLILAVAHDLDISSIYHRIKYEHSTKAGVLSILTFYLPNDLIFDYIKRRCDFFFIQHNGQNIHFKSIRGKTVLFKNIIEVKSAINTQKGSEEYYIYVFSLTILKGTKNLKNLVEILSENINIMIIGECMDDASAAIVNKLKSKKNLVFKGRLNHETTLELISKSKALINTSNYEGFPNIFLEAWSTGVPVISLYVNPDNILNEYNLGVFCNGDLIYMKNCIESDQASNINSNIVITYVERNHDFNNAAERFINAIRN